MDGFGDICCVIPHPLKVLDAKQKVDACCHDGAAFHHANEDFAKKACAQPVDFLVPGPDIDGIPDVPACEAVENVAQLREHERRHVVDALHRPARHLRPIDLNHALADILRQIADALQFVCNPQYPDDVSQVADTGVPLCDAFDGAFLDGAMHQVDRGIGGEEPAST